jgi:cell division septal protein FtsQ
MTEPEAPPGSGKPDESLLAELAQAFQPGVDESGSDEPEPTDEVLPDDAGPDDAGPDDAGPDDAGPDDADPDDEGPANADPENGDPAPEPDTGSDDVRVIETIEDPAPVGGGGMVGEPTVARRTILIGDGEDGDEQPDTIYLDEELARGDDSKGTVFIDDDGSDDAIAPKEAAQTGIEPRIRQRRIRVRRAAGRRRLKWLAIAAVVLLVILGGLAVLGSPLFTIESVRVSGAVYTDADVLDDVVEDLRGTAVLLADTGAAEERLEAIPWVESARVRTDFPDAATIEIRERTPLITMQGADGLFRVLDREGRILDSIEGQPVAMVLVAGPGTLDVEPGAFAPIGHASSASLVTKLTPNVRGRLEAIFVTPDGSDLRLIISNGENPSIEVEFGSALGDNDQIEKLVRLERVLEDIGDDPVLVINVSTSEVTVL